MTKKQQAKEAALRIMDAAQTMVVKHSISRNDNARQADLVLFTDMAMQLLTSGLRQARTTQAQIEVLTNTLVSEMNALMDLLHGQAMDMNEQYDAQLYEIRHLEYKSVMNADLVKVCSMRMFLYKRYMFDRAYDLVSYSKYIDPLFDLLDKIATELAGYPVSASEHNWIVQSAARDEHEERLNAAWKAEAEANYVPMAAPVEATVNPYEILLDILGEEGFAKAILTPEGFENYLIRKADGFPTNEAESKECECCHMDSDSLRTINADDPDNVQMICDPCFFDEHAYDFNRELNTFDDLHPPRPTGFENELKKIW